MGLFGNKNELKKEYFESCFNMSENEIINKRRSQGFTITKYVDAGAVHVKAEKKAFFALSFSITNSKSLYGSYEECVFDVQEMFSYKEVMNFLKQNFPTVPDNVRHKALEGKNFENFYTPSVYLSDGSILALKSSSGPSWFSLQVISKDRIIK